MPCWLFWSKFCWLNPNFDCLIASWNSFFFGLLNPREIWDLWPSGYGFGAESRKTQPMTPQPYTPMMGQPVPMTPVTAYKTQSAVLRSTPATPRLTTPAASTSIYGAPMTPVLQRVPLTPGAWKCPAVCPSNPIGSSSLGYAICTNDARFGIQHGSAVSPGNTRCGIQFYSGICAGHTGCGGYGISASNTNAWSRSDAGQDSTSTTGYADDTSRRSFYPAAFHPSRSTSPQHRELELASHTHQ